MTVFPNCCQKTEREMLRRISVVCKALRRFTTGSTLFSGHWLRGWHRPLRRRKLRNKGAHCTGRIIWFATFSAEQCDTMARRAGSLSRNPGSNPSSPQGIYVVCESVRVCVGGSTGVLIFNPADMSIRWAGDSCHEPSYTSDWRPGHLSPALWNWLWITATVIE